jgi:dephospho-CoA kinase
MLKLKKGAVTGGLSSGKSSVCQILKELGAYIVSADEIVHRLLSSNAKLIREVVNLLGKDVLVNGKIDRFYVADKVFNDLVLLEALEALLHPIVYEEIEDEYKKQQDKLRPPSLFMAEVPLLFESQGEKNFDIVIAVVSDPDLCLERFIAKTGGAPEDFKARQSRQLSQLEKAVKADYVIMNSSTLSNLQDTTKELYLELITI